MWREIRPDAVKVWENKEVKARLSRYYDIMGNKRIAKYLIAKKVPISINLEASTDQLWKEHDKVSVIFKMLECGDDLVPSLFLTGDLLLHPIYQFLWNRAEDPHFDYS